MFYDKFTKLCEEKGVSRKKAVTEMGLSNSLATKWKNTAATPSGETLAKVANYFGVTMDSLLGEEREKTPPSISAGERAKLEIIGRIERGEYSDAEMIEILQIISTRLGK